MHISKWGVPLRTVATCRAVNFTPRTWGVFTTRALRKLRQKLRGGKLEVRCFQKRTRAERHAKLAESARGIVRDGNISEIIARAEGGGGIGHTLVKTDFVEFAGVGSAHVVEGEEGRVIRR